MKYSHTFTLCASMSAVLLALSGCGGTSAKSELGNNISVSATPALTITAGGTGTSTAAAYSSPSVISSMTWVAYSQANGTNLTLTNADCAQRSVTTSGSTLSPTSNWSCPVQILAPLGITTDTTYKMTVTVVDSKGNSTSADSLVTVKPTTTPEPSVRVSGNSTMVSGDINSLNCAASGGSVLTAGKYGYQWVLTNDGGLTNLRVTQQTVTSNAFIVAPAVTTPTLVEVACRATDDSQKTGVGKLAIVISPSAAARIIPSVVDNLTFASGGNTKIDGSKTAYVDGTGAVVASKALYYNWVQKSGPAATLLNANTSSPSVTFPILSGGGTNQKEALVFTMQVSDQPFTGGTTAGAVASYDAVFYVSYLSPITLSIGTSGSVKGGTSGTTSVIATGQAGAPLYYAWSQVSGPSATIAGGNTNSITFLAPANAGPGNLSMIFRVSVSYAPITASNPGLASTDILIAVTP